MKILHVVSDLNPYSGGPTTVLHSLSTYQSRSSLDVTVCTSIPCHRKSTASKIIKNKNKDGVKYHYFPCWSPLQLSLSMIRWFRLHISSFDIIHIHGLYRFPVTSAAWFARKYEIPYLIAPHGSLDPFLFKQSHYNLLLKRVYEKLFDFPNLNHATAIHYTTQDEAKRTAFLKLKPKSIIIPNGIDWDLFKCLPPKGRFRHALNIDNKAPLILFLGRINFKKGIDLLIPAFAQVIKQYPEAILAIVGPDNENYGAKIRKLCNAHNIKDKVYFTGYLDMDKIKEAYVDSNMFVLPSYTENFGLTVVEAMACATPVIISDQVNIWKKVREAKAGLVIKLNIQDLKLSICSLLGDQNATKVLGKNGRNTAKCFYSWPPIVENMTLFYRKSIDMALSNKSLANN